MGLASVDDKLHRDTILLLKHSKSQTLLHWPTGQDSAKSNGEIINIVNPLINVIFKVFLDVVIYLLEEV